MRRIFSFVIFLLLCVVCVQSWTSNYCTRDRYRTVYRWGCVYSTWRGCCRWGWVCVNERYTEYYCCNGWRHNGNRVCNIPICSIGCANGGTCVRPDTCACAPGYDPPLCKTISKCSHLDPCYPGYCDAGGSCVCTNGFTVNNIQPKCTKMPNINEAYPKIDQSTVHYAYIKPVVNMSMYEYTVDASMAMSGTEVIWTNRREFNYLNFTFRALYKTDYDTMLEKSDYVRNYAIGIVKGEIFAHHTKYGQPNPAFSKVYPCQGVSNSNPIANQQFTCEAEQPNFIFRIDHRDEFIVTFSAKTGGIRSYTPSGSHNFEGYNSSKKLHFKFDLFQTGGLGLPYHCSTKNSCGSDKKILEISDDVTKKTFTIRWDGWLDDYSGVARYAWEVYKLQFLYDKLQEPPQAPGGPIPPPLIIRALNHSNSITYPSYTPPEPGVYSVILEVGDRANNTVYARRFVLYDPDSSVTTNRSFPMFVSSAVLVNGKRWHKSYGNGPSGKTNMEVEWRNHFQNRRHEEGHFLDEIDVFKHKLSDESIQRENYKQIKPEYDDFEGKRGRNKIPNFHGIVNFEIFSSNAENPNQMSFSPIPLKENFTLSQAGVSNGGLVKIWIKATDILGNSAIDNTIVYFDNTPAQFSVSPEIEKNIGDDAMDFRSRFILNVIDEQSAVYKVQYSISARRDGNYSLTEEFQNPLRTREHCLQRACDRLPGNSDEYYDRNIKIDISNCKLMVREEYLQDDELDIEFTIFNGASFTTKRTIQLTDLTRLRGVNQYYGPMDIKLEERGPGSARITWHLAPTCYPRYGLMLFVSRFNGSAWVDVENHKIHKDAESFDITGLQKDDRISMLTKYGTDANNIIMSKRNLYSPPPATPLPLSREGSNAGTIAGVIIAILLIIAIAAFIFVMWRTGRLKRFTERRGIREPSFSKAALRDDSDVKHSSKNSYQNRAYSDNFDDDIYIYGGKTTESRWVIPRKAITLQEEITRGRFAVIYKARYSSDTVVAKTLKEHPTEEEMMTMKAKSNFLSELGEHPNILKFIGLVEDDAMGPFMVLEYCENGPMNTYLAKHKDKVNDDMHERLFKLSFEICKGMNFLASKRHVHRRLAARNILLTFTLQAKVTGFGPAPPDHNEDGGEKKQEKIPIKWMAPECITTTKHATEKSDVWSYGIVLWEIFSMGDTPYPNIRSHDVAARLKRGERMKKPEHADDTFYRLMKSCWEYDEKKRPNFEDILDQVEGMFKSTGGDDYYYDQNGLYDNRT